MLSKATLVEKVEEAFNFLLKKNGFLLRILIYLNPQPSVKTEGSFLNIQDLKIYLSCTFFRGLLKEVFQQVK